MTRIILATLLMLASPALADRLLPNLQTGTSGRVEYRGGPPVGHMIGSVADLVHLGAVPNLDTSVVRAANDAALTAALADTSVSRILLPAGLTYFGSAGTATIGRSLTVAGHGPTATTAIWVNPAGGGLAVTTTDGAARLVFRDMTLRTTAAGFGTAIAATCPTTPSGIYPNLLVESVDFGGADISAHTWSSAIGVTNCWNARLRSFHIDGAAGADTTRLMGSAVRFRNAAAITISDFRIFYARTGIEGGNGTSGPDATDEGFNVSKFEMVGVDTCVSHKTTFAHAGSIVTAGHCNATTTGLDLYAKQSMIVSDMSFYKTNDVAADWVGIKAEASNNIQIHHVLMVGAAGAPGGGGMTGISLVNTTGGSVDHITARNFVVGPAGSQVPGGTLVSLGAGANLISVSDIDADADGNAAVVPVAIDVAAGKGNRFHDLHPRMSRTLAVNATAPSVGNAVGTFVTANTAATAISGFTDYQDGQEIAIRIGDGLTTFRHGGSMLLKGGIDASPPGYGWITFRMAGGVAYEASRSW